MEYPLYPSEIQGKHWLSPLGMAVALHLLLVLLGIYAPGFPRFRPEVLEIYTVSLVEVAEPDKTEAEQPKTAQPIPSVPMRKTPPIFKTTRPGPAISRIEPITVASAKTEQPSAATEVSVYGQKIVASVPGETGEKKGEVPSMGNSRLLVGNEAMPTNLSVSAETGEDRGSARKHYLTSILAHIEANKFYPPAARRLKLEGEVRVNFILEANGGISGLQVSEGKPLLEQAAKEAVERSLPLPPPRGNVTVPLPISYRMNFQLR